MSEPGPTIAASPHVRRPVWPGLVWAIPLAALIVVLFLGVRAFMDRGVDVVITFDTASGLKVGDTKVLYQGLEVGHVVKISVGKTDLRHIEVTARLDPRAKPALHTGTVFWLVGAKTSLTDLSSVKAAFSGAYIGVAPSFDGAPTRRFRGFGEEPAVLPDAQGTPYVLTAERLGPLKKRSAVSYRGQEIGKVTAVAMTGPGAFRIDVFIDAPYDRLVRPGAIFWPSSALKLGLGPGGVTAQVDDPAALVAGGLQMDAPVGASGPPSPAGAHFVIYDSPEAAKVGESGPRVPYVMTFSGVGGDLAEGAPVTLLGFTVGQVTSRTLAYDGRTGLPYTRVGVDIEPARLHGGAPPPAQDAASLRLATDADLSGLLARGYRARLVQSPPLVGARGVTLDRVAGQPRATLGGGTPPQIPSLSDSGDIAAQASSILAKVDRIPIEKIGRDVSAITGRLRTLAASPQVDSSLTHLNATLAQADRITAQVEPQVGPLAAKLREAADQAAGAAAAARGMLTGEGTNPDASLPHAVQELSDAAVSMRALADGLARHPEALIAGRKKEPK